MPLNSAKTLLIGQDVKPNPRVSVIIPAYNIAKFIAETLNSVFIQTFTDFEVIVINDGSPDSEDFERVLAGYFSRIVYLKVDNVGAGAARNLGIEEARGELLAFLDGDDVWLPEYLAAQVEFLVENNYDLVYSDALIFGGSAGDGQNFMLNAPSTGEANFESLLDFRCNVITSGTVVRKAKVIEAGLFERERIRAHDFVLWLKIARVGGKIGYQRRVLLKYRVRLESLTGNSIQNIQREIDVFRRIPGMFELNDEQQAVIAKHLTRLGAEIEIERGKSYLLQKDYAAARKAFMKGNEHRRSLKLTLIIWGLRLAPEFLLKFYRLRREKEIAFVPRDGK